MNDETCDCGNTGFIFEKYSNVWQLVCSNCGEVLIPFVKEEVKRKMDIALINSNEEIKKFYPDQYKEIINIKIQLEDMKFRVDNK